MTRTRYCYLRGFFLLQCYALTECSDRGKFPTGDLKHTFACPPFQVQGFILHWFIEICEISLLEQSDGHERVNVLVPSVCATLKTKLQ